MRFTINAWKAGAVSDHLGTTLLSVSPAAMQTQGGAGTTFADGPSVSTSPADSCRVDLGPAVSGVRADQRRAAAHAQGVSEAMSEALVVESLPSTSSM